MRILLFPGSFNPIHFGHTRLLRCAMEEIKPAAALVFPVLNSRAPKKENVDYCYRVEMAKSAVLETLPLPLAEMVEVSSFAPANDDSTGHTCVVEHSMLRFPDHEFWMLLGRGGCEMAGQIPMRLNGCLSFVVSRDAKDEDIDFLRGRGFAVKTLSYKPSIIESKKLRHLCSLDMKTLPRYIPNNALRMMQESKEWR